MWWQPSRRLPYLVGLLFLLLLFLCFLLLLILLFLPLQRLENGIELVGRVREPRRLRRRRGDGFHLYFCFLPGALVILLLSLLPPPLFLLPFLLLRFWPRVGFITLLLPSLLLSILLTFSTFYPVRRGRIIRRRGRGDGRRRRMQVRLNALPAIAPPGSKHVAGASSGTSSLEVPRDDAPPSHG